MTTIENIVNPLPHVLRAWKTILGKRHKVFSVFDYIDPEQEQKLTPYFTITLRNLRASGQQYPIGPDIFWSSWSATLESTAVTMRGKNSDKQDEMAGGVLVLAARYRVHFVKAVLPYHLIVEMKPADLDPSTEGLLDYQKVNLDIQIMVRDDAWPE